MAVSFNIQQYDHPEGIVVELLLQPGDTVEFHGGKPVEGFANPARLYPAGHPAIVRFNGQKGLGDWIRLPLAGTYLKDMKMGHFDFGA